MNTHVLNVELVGPRGECWSAIGGGATLGDALAFALASAPLGTIWRVARWSPLFGD
jgi:hypothetical protein